MKKLINDLVVIREKFRELEMFEEADTIRKAIQALGAEVIDKKDRIEIRYEDKKMRNL